MRNAYDAHYALRITHYALRITHYALRITLCALLLLLLWLISSPPAHAQTQFPAYIRHDAPGQINHLLVTDVTQNGMDEFLIAADGVNVSLVAGDGRAQWPPYRAEDQILYLTAVNLDNDNHPQKEIVIGTTRQLIILDYEGNERWKTSFVRPVSSLTTIDYNQDGRLEILVALSNGLLTLYDADGRDLWSYPRDGRSLPSDAQPQLLTADFDGDGRQEILYAYFSAEGYSQFTLLNGEGEAKWSRERPISGRITAMTLTQFDPQQPPGFAVAARLGATRGRVQLYDNQGNERWLRTPNRPVTSLIFTELPQGPALLLGTSTGVVTAYNERGQQYWSRAYSPTPNRRVAAISSPPIDPERKQPAALAIVLGREAGSADPNQLLLLDSDGRPLEEYVISDLHGASQLTDVNRDGRSELALVSFATLYLLDPGISSGEYAEAWDYRLGNQPQAVLMADINGDNQPEIIIGATDGRMQMLDIDGKPLWIMEELGGDVSRIALAERPDSAADVVIVHNNRIVGRDGVESFEGWLRLFRADGRELWQDIIPSGITALKVGDINNNGRPEILIGTADGQLRAYSQTGLLFWDTAVNSGINHILIAPGDRSVEIVVSARANEILRFNNKGDLLRAGASYLQEINSLYPIEQEGELSPQLFVAVEDGTIRGLNWRDGVELWRQELSGIPLLTRPAGSGFLVATDEGYLYRVTGQGDLLWQQSDLGRATSLYWGDLDGDMQADAAFGNREGEIFFFDDSGEPLLNPLRLGSGIAFMNALTDFDQQPGLVVVTNNGVVQLFRIQPNRAPLLINPRAEVRPGVYGVNITVLDVDDDPVRVTLELFDPETGEWLSQGEKVTSRGSETLTWPIDPSGETAVRYRFIYDDGLHSGVVTPLPGPPPFSRAPLINQIPLWIALLVGLALLVSGSLAWRQIRLADGEAQRFYRQIKQQPRLALELLAMGYNQTNGSPDFLLNLANKARQDEQLALASVADGLFLLSARPDAALPIIVTALEEAEEDELQWNRLDRWLATYQTCQALVEAPSVMELSLLQPQLSQLLKEGQENSSLARLLPVMTSLRDSERVDLSEDRLTYLNEALLLLREEQRRPSTPLSLDQTLTTICVNRWLGLVSAEAEELRGRAELAINLKTKRLAPAAETVIALTVQNNGRAAAEHVVISLEENPAYRIVSQAQTIAYLPPGRTRQANFAIEPLVDSRFRVSFKVNYNDRHHWRKTAAFADMVHLLPPAREFQPIPNPYAPGTPLRRNSALFYGREDLFAFIRENVDRLAQQNVLILVGQRRTGKTSALLQLDKRLPDHLLPIYIDCQSLGLVSGMPALFHDLAWIIADALSLRGYEIEAPEMTAWLDDPGGRFQRQFIPAVRALLPPGTVLLLVFDEFEAFENLVNDGILPPTLFAYLRHLMQHGEGLSFAFVGARRLEEMSADYWSVLFNIALYRQISYLSEAETIRLICDPVSPHLVYDDLALDKIWRVTAGHPYFVQLVCYALVNRANNQRSGYVTISDVNAALEEMLRLGEVHFAYLWQRSSHTERALLTAVSHLMERDSLFRPSDLADYLADYGIHLEPAELIEGLNQLVYREIMREVADEGATLYELRIGLVGLWVAQNKSLSRLYENRPRERELARGGVS
jgi:outer membrane protein assembly factor BamB